MFVCLFSTNNRGAISCTQLNLLVPAVTPILCTPSNSAAAVQCSLVVGVGRGLVVSYFVCCNVIGGGETSVLDMGGP